MSVALAASVGVAAAPLTLASSPNRARTPIEHVVFLLQEDHTFDNYFSSFPGVEQPASSCQVNYLADAPNASDLVNAGIWDAHDPEEKVTATAASTSREANSSPSPTACCSRFHLATTRTPSPNHNAEAAFRAYNQGRMDGFAASQAYFGLSPDLPMGYYDSSELPLYYNLASQYVLAQRFFSSAWGGSQRNHLFTIAGQAPPMRATGYDIPVIFDRLEAAGVSWKFYVQGYDPAVTFRTGEKSTRASQLIWDPLANFPRFLDDPELFSHIVDLEEYFTDVQQNQLPSVAYMVPSGLSEHPPGDVTSGQTFAVSTATALMRSQAWDSSVWIVSWDDWGGWYDHVPPPQVDADGYGFRVPALIVSPYSRPGLIDNTTYDFTSILRFIEDNWSLQPLTARDATANSIANALDFGHEPTDPVIPGTIWPPPTDPANTGRPLLLALYALVVAVPCAMALLLSWRLVSQARRGRRATDGA